MQPSLLTTRRKIECQKERETDRLNEVPGGRHKSECVKGSSPQRMNFISFCDVYQNIDAAFPLDQQDSLVGQGHVGGRPNAGLDLQPV